MHATNSGYQRSISQCTIMFTSDDKPIYLRINKNIVPYWIQDPSTVPYGQGKLLLLLDMFLYGLKLSPLKFQLYLTLEIGLTLSICYLYQDNLSSSKIILKSAKTEQVKHSLSKINLAQQYDADKLYIIIQIPTPYMIADTLTKPEATHNYASFEVNRLRVYALPI